MPKATKKTLKDLHPVILTHKSKVVQEAKSILKTEAQPLFDNFPDIEALRWTQRRPLEASDCAPVHKSDFSIDNVEYSLCEEADWVSPWGDSRIENADLLDGLTVFEEHLFDAQDALALALGDYDRVTVTRTDVTLNNL